MSSTSGRSIGEVSTAKPFLKWAGGKQWLARDLVNLLPSDWSGKYYEPFLGGGAVFFALQNLKVAELSDTNAELITAYRAVKEEPERVIEALRRYRFSAEDFERARRQRPRQPHTAAARLIYLNRTAFNGLYRVSQKGNFNVPFGKFERRPRICQADKIRAASIALSAASLQITDFEVAVASASPGDLVFMDPPYVTRHNNNGFRRYNASLFAWRDQQRLARVVHELNERGVHVVATNADHEELVELYQGLHVYRVRRRSLIAGRPSDRGATSEALVASFPLPTGVGERGGYGS